VLKVSHISKVFGSGERRVQALADISFDVDAGRFVSIVGPSGAGKTTLLLAVAGLQPPSGGTIELHGEPVTGPPADLAVVFQDYARSLFPWLTSRANVELPLKDTGMSRDEVRRRTDESLAAVGLVGSGDRYPWQLSGGMQQRVAIARALALSPSVLLMDEPFASVDAQTRAELEDLLLEICTRYRMTVVFITHDIDEAVYLSDRVVVLSRAPATVVEQVEVDLPAPRDQIGTKRLDTYQQLRAEILGRIQSQRPRAAAGAPTAPSGGVP
jgi:NitT/TauT family transport system ATP-binding protein